MAYVYRHVRLDKNIPFYIGIGRDSDGNHKRANDKSQRNIIWRNIYNKTDIRIDILMDDISNDDAFLKEKEFISLYGRRNTKSGCLCNMTDGGDGIAGFSHSKETRERISKSGKGRKVSQATIEKLRLINKGRKMSPESREKSRLSRIGKKSSDETKRRQSVSLTGRKHKPESIAKMKGVIGKWMIGRKLSEETKAKLSIISRNCSEETRKKIGDKSRGRKPSEETLAKMRIAQIKPPLSEGTKKKLSDAYWGMSDEERELRRIKTNEGRHRVFVSVFCMVTDTHLGDYTTNEASKKFNIGRTTIFRSLNGVTKKPLRYYFKLLKRT